MNTNDDNDNIEIATAMAAMAAMADDESDSDTGFHIFDDVHGYIEITGELRRIIDTPQFQRLRLLKQLGSSYFVYPGATHNRFEHSIGVAILAEKLIVEIQRKQPELRITPSEIYCVKVAGLLHDIGHGPFSHTFDDMAMPRIQRKLGLPMQKYRHEDMSVLLIDSLFRDNGLRHSDTELTLIKAMISPSTHEEVVRDYTDTKRRGFLFEFISNELNGIDVDKWDYILRDSKNTSCKVSFQYDRILAHARVIDNHICFHAKVAFDVFSLFNSRYELFKRVYCHKTNRCIDAMIADILCFAEGVFHTHEKVSDPHKYLSLTDTIIQRIEWTRIKTDEEMANEQERHAYQELQKAQAIIARLNCRKLYKICGELLLMPDAVFAASKSQAKHRRQNSMGIHTKIQYGVLAVEWTDELWAILSKRQRVRAKNAITTQNPSSTGNRGNRGNRDSSHDNTNTDEQKWEPTAEKCMVVVDHCTESDAKRKQPLLKEEVFIKIESLSYGSEVKHPMESVFVFKQKNTCYKMGIEEVSAMGDSNKFREIICRAIVKNIEWRTECIAAFDEWALQKGLLKTSGKRKSKVQFSQSGSTAAPTTATATQLISVSETEEIPAVSNRNSAEIEIYSDSAPKTPPNTKRRRSSSSSLVVAQSETSPLKTITDD